MKVERWVEFLFPGSFYPEDIQIKIDGLSGKEIVQELEKFPYYKRGVFAFSFFDREILEGTLENGEKITKTQRVNETKRFYPNGKLYNLEQIKALGKDYEILASNMECNDWKQVVKTQAGNFQPFEDGDWVVEFGNNLEELLDFTMFAKNDKRLLK